MAFPTVPDNDKLLCFQREIPSNFNGYRSSIVSPETSYSWVNTPSSHLVFQEDPHDSDDMTEYSAENHTLMMFFLSIGVPHKGASSLCARYGLFREVYADFNLFDSSCAISTAVVSCYYQTKIAAAIRYCERKLPEQQDAEHYLDSFLDEDVVSDFNESF